MQFEATNTIDAGRNGQSGVDDDVQPSASPFRDAAIAATAAGLVLVPCGGPMGKTPLIKWKTLDRPISPARLKKWQTDPRFAEANIGVVTGPSGLTVIDCDTPDSLDRLTARFGPTPIIVATPRGGHHLYYHSSGESSGPLRDGDLAIDVKANGGFIVIPPSIRRTGEHAGRTYRFLSGSWADIPNLPPVRAGALIFDEAHASDEQSAHRRNKGTMPVQGRDVGHRNRTLFDTLRSAAVTAEDRGELDDIARVLNQNFEPPLDKSEVDKIVGSVWQYRKTGRLFVADQSVIAIPGSVYDRLSAADNGAYGLMLLACLIRNHGARDARNESFAIVAAGMQSRGVIQGWALKRYRNAVETLLGHNFIMRVYLGGRRRGDPHRYVLGL